MARKPKADYYVCIEGFVTADGQGCPAGEIVEAGSEIMKRRDDLFKPWDGPRFKRAGNGSDDDEPEVEAATAAPGEKRGR